MPIVVRSHGLAPRHGGAIYNWLAKHSTRAQEALDSLVTSVAEPAPPCAASGTDPAKSESSSPGFLPPQTMSTSPYASPRFKEGTSPLVPPQYSPAAPRMSPVAAEMLARSVRASSGLGCASLFAPPRVAPLKRAARPLAASPEPPAPAAEELLQASAVEDGVRDFYRSVQSTKALPKTRTALGSCMETLRRRYQGKHGYRKLHAKEVQLLALLHDAGLPVLGADTLGKVVCVATTSKWRWEFAGVLGGNCDTKAAALEEPRSVRSPNPSGTTVWLNGPPPAPTDASVPAAPLGTSRARVPLVSGHSHLLVV